MPKKLQRLFSSINDKELCIAMESAIERQIEKQKRFEKMRLSDSTVQLKVCKHRNVYQCYFVNCNTGKTQYVSREDPQVSRIIQSEYAEKCIKTLDKSIIELKKCIEVLQHENLINVYKSTNAGRKTLLKAAEVDDESFISAWKAEKYESKPMREDADFHVTQNGEHVRSKSEVIIADELARLGIPYKYEKPYLIEGFAVYPDFTILNTETRREVIWEHFGLLDDPQYRDMFVKKMEMYQDEGYRLGLDLFVTFETGKRPLTRQRVLATIEQIIGKRAG